MCRSPELQTSASALLPSWPVLRTLAFWLVYTLVPLVAAGVVYGGVWSFAALAYVFFAVPLIDALAGITTANPEPGQARSRWIDLPLWLWAPTQLAIIGAVIWRVTQGEFQWWESAGLVLSAGIVNGAAGITIAHELMHRKTKLDRALAEVLMMSVSYTHFCVEHVYGHHRHVSTPRDPASSRMNESLYRFYPRVVWGSLKSAWRIEGDRVARKGISGLADRRVRYPLLWLATCAGIIFWAGPLGLGVFLVMGWISFSLLEVINYVEHYGLERRELSPGKYERVQPEHSWNSSHRFSNWYLFNLARHSDHHYLASRPYDQLRHYEDVPQLPAGYATMLLSATVPPLWFKVMNPRVHAWRASREGAVEPAPVDASMQPAV